MSNFNWTVWKTIGGRVLAAFVLAFLTALGADAAHWTVSLAEKAAVAGLVAAAELVRSIVWTYFSGAPQLTKTGRLGASRV